MALGHLLYISDALRPMSREDLDAIRDVSVMNNAKLGITGVLFYSAGHFVQLLEGEPDAIHELYEKIVRDVRHRKVRLLVERPVDRRIFTDWNMGLLDLDQHGEDERDQLEELVQLAGQGEVKDDGTPIEMEILSRFCMLLSAA